jgi:hypothetical protein
MNSEEISTFWEYERRRYAAQDLPSAPPPLLIKDIYHEFLEPKLLESREDWDNLSDDVLYLDPSSRQFEDWEIGRSKKSDMNEFEQVAHLSFGHCRRACESLSDCFQFRYQNGICGTSWAFKLGKPVKKPYEEFMRWTSGWDVKKIDDWVEKQGDCSNWVWPST